MVGGAFGLVVTDRPLVRVAPLRLLAGSSAICVAVYVAWLAAPTMWLSALLMVAVGATAAPMYPLGAPRRLYAALPGRSGTVNAAGHVFTPLSLALPWLLGWIADHAGLMTAIALLIVQPVGHRRSPPLRCDASGRPADASRSLAWIEFPGPGRGRWC